MRRLFILFALTLIAWFPLTASLAHGPMPNRNIIGVRDGVALVYDALGTNHTGGFNPVFTSAYDAEARPFQNRTDINSGERRLQYGYDQGEIANACENASENYGYDAVHNLIQPVGDLETDVHHEGTEWLENAEAYYLRARYYKPETGRFWTMDTYEGRNEDPASLHKYLYCRGDGVNRIDPSGHEDLISVLAAMTIASDMRAMKERTTIAAKKALTTQILDVYVGLAPGLPFGHSGVFVNNTLSKRGWLFHVEPLEFNGKASTSRGSISKDEYALRSFQTSFSLNKKFTTFSWAQYMLWQTELKIIGVDDDFSSTPVDYSMLGFDIFLGQPYSCHSFTIKAVMAAWGTSKMKL